MPRTKQSWQRTEWKNSCLTIVNESPAKYLQKNYFRVISAKVVSSSAARTRKVNLFFFFSHFNIGRQDRELHLVLGGRHRLLRPHPQLLPSGLRLRQAGQEQQEAELRPSLQDRRVSVLHAANPDSRKKTNEKSMIKQTTRVQGI